MARYCYICDTTKPNKCVGGDRHAYHNPNRTTIFTPAVRSPVDQSSAVKPENKDPVEK